MDRSGACLTMFVPPTAARAEYSSESPGNRNFNHFIPFGAGSRQAQHILHAVPTGGFARQPLGGSQGAAGEDVAR